jgi:hypothetical protein
MVIVPQGANSQVHEMGESGAWLCRKNDGQLRYLSARAIGAGSL